jgi:hypothetical protein
MIETTDYGSCCAALTPTPAAASGVAMGDLIARLGGGTGGASGDSAGGRPPGLRLGDSTPYTLATTPPVTRGSMSASVTSYTPPASAVSAAAAAAAAADGDAGATAERGVDAVSSMVMSAARESSTNVDGLFSKTSSTAR